MEAPRALSTGVARGGYVRSGPSTTARAGRLTAPAASSAGRRLPLASSSPRLGHGGRRALLLPSPPRALPPDAAQHAADLLAALPDALAHAATLAYEPVAAPCSLMNCGDVVHRR
jgi:hypothetical protein